jgi:putative ABC transport system permease protein
MFPILKIITESAAQAFQSLRSNKLRSFLSLLGISIGIFCIIGVKSAVDSLENNVRSSLEKLGSDVVYLSKFSWKEDPGDNFMKIMRRPNPSYEDFKVIGKKVKTAQMVSLNVDIGQKTLQYKSSSVERVGVTAVTYNFERMYELDFRKGRYFSQQEFFYGANKVVLGHNAAKELFGDIEPIGKEIKLLGRKLAVIGVLEKSGEDLLGIGNFDDVGIISYETGKKMANLKSTNAFGNVNISIKAAENVSNAELIGEVTGVIRAFRKLKPKEEDDFALNEVSMMGDALDTFFGALNLMGILIGGFAMLVGGFSVANIMFVSVKEQTNIIGIKKALGAKRYIILLEFLIESIILCLIGGAVGLVLVFLVVLGISSIESFAFDISLSLGNIIKGLSGAIFIGILSGLIPAIIAAWMDPVVAIRSK